MSKIVSNQVFLEPQDTKRLASLCGPFDENIKQIERLLVVEIAYRNSEFSVHGDLQQANGASELLKLLYIETHPVRGRVPALEPN